VIRELRARREMREMREMRVTRSAATFRAALVVAAVVTTTWLAGACANAIAPEGGPPDVLPPLLMQVSPENGDTSVRPKVVALQFNEVISETPKGASDLAGLVFISPRSGDISVDWKRSRMEIRPRSGFRDSTVYTITIRPGVQDLRNNGIDTALTIVFSTRGAIPQTTVSGVVFDWPAGRGARNALVEAISVVDTTVAYIAVSDSVGRFAMRFIPPGQYLVRGFIDGNKNRLLERTELWDSVRIPLLDSAAVDLYSFIHDTTPVRITEMVVQDSGRRMRLTFDKPLAPGQMYTPPQFTIRALPDSTPMAQRVVQVRTGQQQLTLDSTERKRREDSVAAVALARDTIKLDSTAQARADSVARVKRLDSLATVERAQREARRRALTLGGPRPATRVDSTPPPKMSRPVPDRELLIVFDAPVPDNIRIVVEARDITSLNQIVGTARRPFLVPKRDTAPTRDTAAAGARGAAPPPRPPAPRPPAPR